MTLRQAQGKLLPKVMIGGPVRDREWIAPTWLNALIGLDYPSEQLRLAVLVNDSVDRTAEVCSWWSRMAAMRGIQALVEQHDFGCAIDNAYRGAGAQRDYLQFARVRDAWVDLRDDAEWLLSVDSDIQVPANLLRRLIELATEHSTPMLAAVIENNYGSPRFFCNVMTRDERGGYWWPSDVIDDFSDGVKPCDLTGACVLLHRSIFDAGLRYAVPLAVGEGEDAPFCQTLISRGIQPHYAPSVRATHFMRPPVELSYLRDAEWHRRLAAWHAAEAQEHLHVREAS